MAPKNFTKNLGLLLYIVILWEAEWRAGSALCIQCLFVFGFFWGGIWGGGREGMRKGKREEEVVRVSGSSGEFHPRWLVDPQDFRYCCAQRYPAPNSNFGKCHP